MGSRASLVSPSDSVDGIRWGAGTDSRTASVSGSRRIRSPASQLWRSALVDQPSLPFGLALSRKTLLSGELAGAQLRRANQLLGCSAGASLETPPVLLDLPLRLHVLIAEDL